jgi:hypothetical protein
MRSGATVTRPGIFLYDGTDEWETGFFGHCGNCKDKHNISITASIEYYDDCQHVKVMIHCGNCANHYYCLMPINVVFA